MHPHQMTDPAQVREFVFAGNARLTLVSKKTGARFTYRVSAADGDGPASHFVSVLTGPDNEGDYTYLGLYRWQDVMRSGPGHYEHGRKSAISPDAPSAKAWQWFDMLTIGRGLIPTDLEIYHENHCGRCGKLLTTPESVTRGFGPECAGRL